MFIYQPDRILLQAQIKKFARYVGGRVLDVGSGGQNRYKHLFKYDQYICMDYIAGKEVDVVGSADSMPFGDAEFDSVVSTQVFEHLQFPEKAAQEIFRVLKDGGHALITVPQWNELHEEPYDYWRYTKYGLKDLFERNGFVTVDFDQRGGYFANRAQMHMRYLIDRFHLHSHPIAGRIFSRIFQVAGTFAIFLDRHDTSVANRKHAIGWCFVFRKK